MVSFDKQKFREWAQVSLRLVIFCFLFKKSFPNLRVSDRPLNSLVMCASCAFGGQFLSHLGFIVHRGGGGVAMLVFFMRVHHHSCQHHFVPTCHSSEKPSVFTALCENCMHLKSVSGVQIPCVGHVSVVASIPHGFNHRKFILTLSRKRPSPSSVFIFVFFSFSFSYSNSFNASSSSSSSLFFRSVLLIPVAFFPSIYILESMCKCPQISCCHFN